MTCPGSGRRAGIRSRQCVPKLRAEFELFLCVWSSRTLCLPEGRAQAVVPCWQVSQHMASS